MARRHTRPGQGHLTQAPDYPQYEWAFDDAGQPVHISQARRGSSYICPVCHNKMIARLGDVKQHHFAHDSLQYCTPDSVTEAAAGRWIARSLRDCLAGGSAIHVTWPCPICGRAHTVNLMNEVTRVDHDYQDVDFSAEIALLDAAGKLRAAVVLEKPDLPVLRAFDARNIALIVVDLAGKHGQIDGLATLLKNASIYGGLCETQKAVAEQGVITDPPTLRQLLIEVVSRPPYHLHGELRHDGGLTNLFYLGNKRLWLPLPVWRRAFGGTYHPVRPSFEVLMQELPQDDGSIVVAYYVASGSAVALAVRRFFPGQTVSSSIRQHSRTPADLARDFAECSE